MLGRRRSEARAAPTDILAGAPAASWKELSPHLLKVHLRPDAVSLDVRTSIGSDCRYRVGEDAAETLPDGAIRLVPATKPAVRGGRV